jgi:predicted RNA binding protein YcfA (HicA-like mRNA interferase family)
MGRWRDLVEAGRRSPANVRFHELCLLLEHLGFVERRRAGSHRIYRHGSRQDVPLVNLQAGGTGKAKPYQVRQVLSIIDAYGLEVDE